MYDNVVRGVGYILVASLWGCTNPFIKNAQEAINSHEDSKDKSNGTDPICDGKPSTFTSKFIASNFNKLKGLFTHPQLFLPYIINQLGSLVYYAMLSKEPISRANPICNSMTFLFTAITGTFS